MDKDESTKQLKIHSIATYLLIYPTICYFTAALAGLSSNISIKLIIPILFLGYSLGLIPSIVLFIKDQKKIRQFKKDTNDSSISPIHRLLQFLIGYSLVVLFMWNCVYMIYDFIQHAK